MAAPQHPLLKQRVGNFDDFDDFAEHVEGWTLDMRQLDRGPFCASLSQVLLDDIGICLATFNRRLEFRGVTPVGQLTIDMPSRRTGPFVWKGRRCPPGSALVYTPSASDVDNASPEAFETVTVSVPFSALETTAQAVGLSNLPDRIQRGGVVQATTPEWLGLRRCLVRHGAATQRRPTQGDCVQSLTVQRDELLHALVIALSSTSVPPSRTTTTRDTMVNRTLAIIRGSEDHTLRMGELCRRVGVSKRTLQYAFRERFDIGPKRYLHSYRLNRVHRTLRVGSPNRMRVADAANLWGFWHMGQLAADYRQMFGELPSDTLQRSLS